MTAPEKFRIYHRDNSVVFYKTKEAFGGLSNMASGYPLRVNNHTVYSTEALYQACRYPLYPEIQKKIISQINPMQAKMYAKPDKNLTREDWEFLKHKVMRWCLRVKLAQHYNSFGKLLLLTGNSPIVEQSRKDTYWGAKIQPDGNCLIGENTLGRLLMELRERIKQDNGKNLLIVPPLRIPNFYLLGDEIQEISVQKEYPDASLSLFSDQS